jgi:hypothetical protein
LSLLARSGNEDSEGVAAVAVAEAMDWSLSKRPGKQEGGKVMAATAEAIEGTLTQREPSDPAVTKRSGDPANSGGRRGGSSLERVTVNLSQRTSEALEQLARMTGESKTDSINKALLVFAYLQQVQLNGGAIYVREPDSKEVERLKIF